VISSGCPPVPEYSRERQAQAADELAALPPGAMLREMMKDYSVIRAQLRHCQ
jgi:hypothetical protein